MMNKIAVIGMGLLICCATLSIMFGAFMALAVIWINNAEIILAWHPFQIFIRLMGSGMLIGFVMFVAGFIAFACEEFDDDRR